ncbi:hypothetical protein AMS68_004726 [Peltaster fructicola]|uniref:Precorrin-2 dehydrogenase n=1 Tax=Peltaster fructicola TaxID=286661 RepID=A0A6H0XX62_9PEZI|nr:hypothetical protein AMS68_004726 [Peltaster fructicola]
MHPTLLTSVDSTAHIHVIIGANSLAGARCAKSLEVGAVPILITPETDNIHYGLVKRIEEGKVQWLKREFQDDDLITLGREEVDHHVDAVFVTTGSRAPLSTHISTLCRRKRIPVNVADAPNLCTFALLSTHTSGPLQIGVTTSGKGCKLASRIRREIAAALPAELGPAVARLGTVRRRIWEEDHAAEMWIDPEAEEDEQEECDGFHRYASTGHLEDSQQSPTRMSKLFESYQQETARAEAAPLLNPSTLDARSRRGRIILAGSGPGHPDLLTTATLKAIRGADIILADKLVPAGVLELIPRRTPVEIAKKFPGNADNAQEEFLRMGLQAAQQGKTVVRLKQGDPYLYGRGAEEFDFFRSHGFTATVLPGITSSLSAPLFAKIPVTHRAVSDQVLVCTGTGRKGAAPNPPAYLPNQTVVFLMALHRLEALRESLVKHSTVAYPASTPCAVIERASCPDQRVIRTTLEYVTTAVEEEGSRPPGLLVVGKACEVLEKTTQKWIVEEGFSGLDALDEICEGAKGLDGLRESLVTPGIEAADPLS